MSEPKTKIVATGVGRRKSATASVRLISGTGTITVNGLDASKFFPGVAAKVKYDQPFHLLSLSKYDASVKVAGGGNIGQLDATVLGIARALVKLKPEHKTPLRTAGLLTRDPRERQRRMVGTGGKARRQKQSPKR